MAANIFQAGGGNNWNSTLSWSLGAIPTASDGNTATLNATSPNCTVNVAAVCNGLDFTGYTNTITLTNGITTSGNITFKSGLLTSGTGNFTINTTGTITCNTFRVPNTFTFSGAGQTFTLADNLNLTNMTYSATTTSNITGAFNIDVNTSLSATGPMTTIGAAQPTIVMSGTGTLSSSAIANSIITNLTINTAGTITIGAILSYGTGTFTYTAGTVDTTTNNSTFNIRPAITSNTTTVLNVSGITWKNVGIGNLTNTYTLTSDINVSGNLDLAISGSSGTATINGLFNINVGGNISQTTSLTIAGTVTFVMTGAGSFAPTNFFQCSLTFNGTGTISHNTATNLGSSTQAVVITYISGTMNLGTSSVLFCNGNITFNTYPVKWNFIDFTNSDGTVRTITINSPLLVKSLKVLGTGASATTTLAGSYGFDADMATMNISNVKTLTLSPGVTYKVNNYLQTGSNLDSPNALNINTSVSGQKARIFIGTYCNAGLQNLAITDVDNVGPNIVPIFQNPSLSSSLTRSAGWIIVPSGQTFIPTATVHQGLDQGIVHGQY